MHVIAPGVNGFLIPADEPPRRSSLKRQLLFFDQLLLVDPKDEAVANLGELALKYPELLARDLDGDIEWPPRALVGVSLTPYAAFPRREGFIEAYRELIDDTTSLQQSGVMAIVPAGNDAKTDAGQHFVGYRSSIGNEDLVRSAVPDIWMGNRPVISSNCILHSPSDRIPLVHGEWKHEVAFPVPFEIPGVEFQWSAVAWTRIGRVVKFLQKAQARSAVPVVLDDPNANILLTYGRMTFGADVSPSALSTLAISLDAVVDPVALDKALLDASWSEVVKLRDIVLPRVRRLREVVLAAAKHTATLKGASLDSCRGVLSKLQREYVQAQESHAKAWRDIKIVAVKDAVDGMHGAAVGGLVGMVLAGTFGAVLGALGSGCVKAGTGAAKDIGALMSARGRLHGHPLFFFNNLPTIVSDLRRQEK